LIRRLLVVLLLLIFAAPAFAQNAADVYGNAVENATGIGNGMTKEMRDALYAVARDGGEGGADVSRLLADNAGVLDSVAKAAGLKHSDFNPGKKSEIDRPLINVGSLRDLALLLTVRSRAKAARRDMAGASADLEGVLMLGRRLLEDRIDVYKMVGLMILERAMPAAGALRGQAAFRAFLVGFRLPSLSRIVEDERRSYLEVLQRFSSEEAVRALGLGDLVLKNGPALSKYYAIDGAEGVKRLGQALEKKYGTPDGDKIAEQLKSRPPASKDAAARDLDAALLLARYPMFPRIEQAYRLVAKALEAVRR
jgi:hypothetical protein